MDKNKRKLRLSLDNRSVAKAVIHFPLQKLLTFCSLFADLLPPQDFRQALNAAGEMPAICTEWKIKQFCRGLLRGRRMQVSRFKCLEQFFIPRMDT